MPRIDHHKAIELLREVVKGNEFHIYQEPKVNGEQKGCKYYWDGEPSCLVGKALALGGFTNDQLAELDNSPDADGGTNASTIYQHFPEVTAAASLVFDRAQTMQDRSHPWRAALQEAEMEYGRMVEDEMRAVAA